MKPFVFIVSLILLLSSSCGNMNRKKAAEQELKAKMDSLKKELRELKEQTSALNHPADTSIQTELEQTANTSVDSIHPPVKKEKVADGTPNVQPVKKEKDENKDTTYHYYTTGKKISVKIFPWKDRRRKIYLYNRAGNITYEFEEVRLSYTESVTIEAFHPNGAVARIKTHSNPGGSRYMYGSTITFGTDNEPQWKESMKEPADDLNEYMNRKSYWDEKTKSWKKQEIIQEQPYPLDK